MMIVKIIRLATTVLVLIVDNVLLVYVSVDLIDNASGYYFVSVNSIDITPDYYSVRFDSKDNVHGYYCVSVDRIDNTPGMATTVLLVLIVKIM